MMATDRLAFLRFPAPQSPLADQAVRDRVYCDCPKLLSVPAIAIPHERSGLRRVKPHVSATLAARPTLLSNVGRVVTPAASTVIFKSARYRDVHAAARTPVFSPDHPAAARAEFAAPIGTSARKARRSRAPSPSLATFRHRLRPITVQFPAPRPPEGNSAPLASLGIVALFLWHQKSFQRSPERNDF